MLILLASASLLFGVACSGDDDDDTATGGSDTTAADGSDSTEAPDLGDAGGYNDAIEGNFMSQCVPAAAGVADAEGMCQCTWDAIVETVPFDEFVAYDEALRNGDTSATPPAGLMEATTQCAAEAGA
jgi:hypothetical protein